MREATLQEGRLWDDEPNLEKGLTDRWRKVVSFYGMAVDSEHILPVLAFLDLCVWIKIPLVLKFEQPSAVGPSK